MTSTTPPLEAPDSTEPLAATPPGFGPASHAQPTRDPLNPERSTTDPTPTPTPPDPDPWMTGDGADAGGPGSYDPTTRPLGPSQVFTPDPGAFEGVIATAAGLVSLGLNRKLSPDTNAWLANETQAHDIAAPLSRIAARHVKLSDKAMANDLGDGLEAAIATVGYVVTSSQRDAAARQQAAAWPDPTQAPAP